MGRGSQEEKVLGAWFSPFVYRVLWALKLQRIEYEFVEERLTTKSSLLLKTNPIHKKIPVLIHGGKSTIESLHIAEHIDETWKHNPILPQDPYQKALARSRAYFLEEKSHDVIRRALVFEGKQQEQQVKAMEMLEEELNNSHKVGRKFFGGKEIGFVDIGLGFMTVWLDGIEEAAGFKVFNSVRYPFLHKWRQNFLEFPVIKENLPSPDKLANFFQKYRRLSLLQRKRSISVTPVLNQLQAKTMRCFIIK